MNLATSSKEYARGLKRKPIGAPMIPNKDALSSYSPNNSIYEQINPIRPVRSSTNWATEEPSRGFNMDDISTYVVRPADRLQAALFDRFILEDYAAVFKRRKTQDPNLGELITSKLGPPSTEKKEHMTDKRTKARTMLDGHNYSSNKAMNKK
jgi:hypothetical protein